MFDLPYSRHLEQIVCRWIRGCIRAPVHPSLELNNYLEPMPYTVQKPHSPPYELVYWYHLFNQIQFISLTSSISFTKSNKIGNLHTSNTHCHKLGAEITIR